MDEEPLNGCVVVGIDGSEHSDRALVWAAEQADLERRRLVVLHGFRSPVVADPAWRPLSAVETHRGPTMEVGPRSDVGVSPVGR